MSHSEREIADDLNTLVAIQPVASGTDTVLVQVREFCAPLEISGLVLADGDGCPLACLDPAGLQPEGDWSTAIRAIVDRLRKQPLDPAHCAVRLADGDVLMGLRFGLAPETVGYLGFMSPRSSDTVQCDAQWWRRLALMARVASVSLRAEQECQEHRTRVEHLLTQQATVMGDHESIVEEILEEREAAMVEKQRLIDSLEGMVTRRTEELSAAVEQAKIASQHKSEFLANTSHEIRTPMTAILGYADVLARSDNLSDEQREAVHTIVRNGKHLLALINDILDLTKIEAGKLVVERIDCKPVSVIAEIASLMRVRAEEKRLQLDVRFDGPVPAAIQSDPTRLRQILANLVGNAIKFTDTGRVTLAARLVSEVSDDRAAPAGGLVQFDVIDTGVGITEEQMRALFQPFTQGDSSTTRKHGGTGLGLAISRRLANMLGGDITVTSAPGEGSTFRVTIGTGPLASVPMLRMTSEAFAAEMTKPPEIEIDEGPLRGRVLLVEDGPDNRRLIAAILRKAGLDVDLAENGRIACERNAAAAASGCPYDLILSDMQMPEMDGYEAARRLRRDGYTGPIIALTAHAMPEEREKCITAGCDDFATKPINRSTLLGILRMHLERASRLAADRDD